MTDIIKMTYKMTKELDIYFNTDYQMIDMINIHDRYGMPLKDVV